MWGNNAALLKVGVAIDMLWVIILLGACSRVKIFGRWGIVMWVPAMLFVN